MSTVDQPLTNPEFGREEKPRLSSNETEREVRRLAVPTNAELRIPKVAVTGAPCSGKSTAIAELGKSLEGRISTAHEQARILFEDVLYIPDRLKSNPQYRLAHWILLEERRAAEAGLPIIADRTVLDGPAFVLWGGDRTVAEQVINDVTLWVATYDQIILCDTAEISYESDSVRVETPEQRDGIHHAFIDMFKEFGIEYSLLSGSKEERHDHITAIVRELS